MISIFLIIITGVMSVPLAGRAHPQGIAVTGAKPEGWLFHYIDGHTSPGWYYFEENSGELLYCIEPHANRVGGPRTEWSTLDQYFGNDKKFANRLSLIGYFGIHSGWGLDGWAAAQSLIWSYVMKRNGETGTQWISTGTITSEEVLQTYYAAIEEKVEFYLKTPDFGSSAISLEAGKEITLTDKNGVFSTMEVQEVSGPLQISRNGNGLTIKATGIQGGTGSIRLVKPLSGALSGTGFAYVSENLQDMMTCGYYEPVFADIKVSITPARTEVKFSKQAAGTGMELPGAALKVTAFDGTEMDSWISGEEPHSIAGLLVGQKYVLTEALPAPGYATAAAIPFTVEQNTGMIIMEDAITRVEISKQDMATGEELPGARLQVTNEAGEIIEEWVSEEEPHVIEGLVVGKTYFLTELLPAPGYATAEPIPFTVEDTGEVQQAVMEDDITKVEISKRDITTGEELSGARLQVKNEAGEIIEEWVSEEEPHVIEGLTAGETYLLTELLPAPGYVTAEPIPFMVEDTGEVQQVVMEDAVTRVEISKRDMATGEELTGARLQITNEAGEVIEEWVSEEEPHVIEGLKAGETYRLHEELPPDGYLEAEDIFFQVEDTAEIQTVIMNDQQIPIKTVSDMEDTHSLNAPATGVPHSLSAPATGDTHSLGIPAAGMILSAVLLGGLYVCTKRKQYNDKQEEPR